MPSALTCSLLLLLDSNYSQDVAQVRHCLVTVSKVTQKEGTLPWMDRTIPWEGTLSAHLVQLPGGLRADVVTVPGRGHCPHASGSARLGLSRRVFQALGPHKRAGTTQGNSTLSVPALSPLSETTESSRYFRLSMWLKFYTLRSYRGK